MGVFSEYFHTFTCPIPISTTPSIFIRVSLRLSFPITALKVHLKLSLNHNLTLKSLPSPSRPPLSASYKWSTAIHGIRVPLIRKQ